jgi:ureidoacrylate peracid hydrolase
MLSREVAITPQQAALLLIDLQNYNCHPQGGKYRSEALSADEAHSRYSYFFTQLSEVTENLTRLLTACRTHGIEVIYTVIESLTADGRDRSLDYKITGFQVPKGSWDAQVIAALAPQGDEMVFPKTSSSVFISTNLHYVLGNLGVRYLMIAGCLTDQCVSSAVRDACDLGYLVTLVTDGCTTHSHDRHLSAIEHIRGYCRQRTTAELLAELSRR